MITIERKVLEQALDALNHGISELDDCNCVTDSMPLHLSAIALRGALAQPAAQPTEPAGEPVMIYHGRCTIDCGEHGHQDVELLKMIPAGSTLYTRPAVPLTRERVAAIMEEATGLSASGMDDLDSFEWLVRKVEADHKIGGAE
jgi:hypothetical protein